MQRRSIDKFFLGGLAASALLLLGTLVFPKPDLKVADDLATNGQASLSIVVSSMEQAIVYSADRSAACLDSISTAKAAGMTTPFFIQTRELGGQALFPVGEANGYRGSVTHHISCTSSAPVYYATWSIVTETGLVFARFLAVLGLALFGMLVFNELRT